MHEQAALAPVQGDDTLHEAGKALLLRVVALHASRHWLGACILFA
jgi:hypothetical protein